MPNDEHPEVVWSSEMRPGVPCMEVSSFAVVGGVHYYGTLWCRGCDGALEECEVVHPMTEAQAKQANLREMMYGGHARFAPGSMTNQFLSEDELCRHAKRQALALWDWEGGISRIRGGSPTLDVSHKTHLETEIGVFI